jgi:conjugative transfer signal peptidase TraF
MCGLMVAVLAIHGLGLVLNITPSMPLGLYRATPLHGDVTRGSIVQACPPESIAKVGIERGYLPAGSCMTGAAPILKIVVAAAGDRVDVATNGITINGKKLPSSRRAAFDGRHRKISAIPAGTYVLSPDEVWLWTPYPGSWDSRYFGPISARNLIARAQLVLALQAWPYATGLR